MDGYEVWETNRKGTSKGGGGLTLIYRSSLSYHKYIPAVPDEYQYIKDERQWLLLSSGSSRLAFLHLYIACQNTRDNSFIQWNDDLFSLITQEALDLKRQGFFILAMGDFNSRVGRIPGLESNTPDLNQNSQRFFRFLEEVNLLVINTLPVSKGVFTRFDNFSGSKSLLDYALIDKGKAETVNTFVIDEHARFRCGSDHALLHCSIEFQHRLRANWQFKESFNYNIRGSTNYASYRSNLDKALSSMSLYQFSQESAASKLHHITECIHFAAKESIGFKKFRRKKGRRLPAKIISMIKTKSSLLLQLRMGSSSSSLQHERLLKEYKEIKEKLDNEILSYKIKKRSAIRSKLLLKDPNRKSFWRFVRGQMAAVGVITALRNKEGEMVFDKDGIQDVVMNHFSDIFCGQQVPVYESDNDTSNEELPSGERKYDSEHFEDVVCAPYSYMELDDLLSNLSSGKASGHDR